ncbi:MAG TPA: glycosyltransferase [Acetobacteraceae bacterium]|nr:glycosyltransferase [Acetobacteraceae bacterium]
MSRAPISGFVIAYNRASLVGTSLRSLRFVDELIVIDKSSTDDTPAIARRYADKVITVPWSPTVEETRAFALEQCRHDWIAFLDDDEMLNPAAIAHLHAGPTADAVALPLRHWILGAFDPEAYYWPEHHIRFFRKGAVSFRPVVHGGMQLHAGSVERVAPKTQIFIEHLSHRDAEQWIERTNRYTSRPSRVNVEAEGTDLIDFAHRRIDHWLARGGHTDGDDYPAAVALLRAIYDMVDRIKAWETQRGIDGAAAFRARCAELEQAYDALETSLGIATGMHR